jgi:hypothetical protein
MRLVTGSVLRGCIIWRPLAALRAQPDHVRRAARANAAEQQAAHVEYTRSWLSVSTMFVVWSNPFRRPCAPRGAHRERVTGQCLCERWLGEAARALRTTMLRPSFVMTETISEKHRKRAGRA